MPSKQETFDTVCEFLINQGRGAVAADGSCAYRGEGGSKCAVGCLIPDDAYNPAWEGNGVLYKRTLEFHNGKYESPAIQLTRYMDSLGHDVDLLAALQGAHDGAADIPAHFIDEFARLATDAAEDHKLSTKRLDELLAHRASCSAS